MRKHLWLLVGLVIPASMLAQELTNAPAASASLPSSAAPAQPANRTGSTTELKTVPLVPGPATVVARNVNVRGKAGLKGEVIARVTKGDQVTVLEEITLSRSAADEPSAWAKIVLPPTAHVWVHGDYVKDNTVVPRRLNLRAGPGENYSVIGQLEQGDTVQVIRTEGVWQEIAHPSDAYAFMAAQYLEQTPPAATVAAAESKNTEPVSTDSEPAVPDKPVETPVTVGTVQDEPEVKPATSLPEVASTSTSSAAEAETNSITGDTWTTTNEVAATSEPEQPLPPRIVQREGNVRGTISIQAPTRYELWSPESGRVINYLYTTSPDLDLSRYKGLRIIVTGEEALDERWRNTPVITIQKIVVLD